MNTIASERLRPMTDTERTAVELFEELAAGGKPAEEVMAEISSLTGLPGPQIAAAVELKGKFGSLLQEVAGAPKASPAQIAAKPAAKPKPAAPVSRPETSDTDALITAAENSPQPRARELAAEIRRALAAVRQIMRDDEKVRVLTASVEVMRRQLAADEAELQRLLGNVPMPVGEPAPVEADAKQASDASTPTPSTTSVGRDPLAYSDKVRTWAKGAGWEVGSAGRISGAVVSAYRAAHPETVNGHRAAD